METMREKIDKAVSLLLGDLGYVNKMMAPRIEKVVLSAGVGSIHDKRKRELVADRLSLIAGQKAVWRSAKKSIATFKLRQGDPVGVMVTLRGERMYNFLDKLIHVAIPRMRDFKGLETRSLDHMGNLTIGIPEHTVFPEAGDEDLRDIFGFAVVIVTTAKNKEEALALFRRLGFPFKKEEK